MKLLDYFSVLGQSASEISFARSVYQTMLQHHLGLVVSEAEKKAKAQAQIAETGKTKMAWDEDVAKKNYAWSIDVLYNELKVSRPMATSAMKYLEANGFVKRLFLSARPTQCYYVPLKDVLANGKS